MRLVDLDERMASRASEVAGFNPFGAIRIAKSMMALFGKDKAVKSLRSAGYLNVQMARAARHQAGGNHGLAELIYTHLRDGLLEGDEDELSGFRWAFDFVLREPTPLEPLRCRFGFVPVYD